MYSVRDFGGMITDDVRRTAYLAAIRKFAPGARVLDLGCGTGFFTLAALELGAEHVTAIDLADGVRLLPQVIAQNGYCLLYTSPSPRDQRGARMPSSA